MLQNDSRLQQPEICWRTCNAVIYQPTDVERLVEGGVKITSVNVGGMAFRQGKTQVNNAVSVDEKDIEAFKKLNARGIELEVRKVSTDPKLKMMDLISKIDK